MCNKHISVKKKDQNRVEKLAMKEFGEVIMALNPSPNMKIHAALSGVVLVPAITDLWHASLCYKLN